MGPPERGSRGERGQAAASLSPGLSSSASAPGLLPFDVAFSCAPSWGPLRAPRRHPGPPAQHLLRGHLLPGGRRKWPGEGEQAARQSRTLGMWRKERCWGFEAPLETQSMARGRAWPRRASGSRPRLLLTCHFVGWCKGVADYCVTWRLPRCGKSGGRGRQQEEEEGCGLQYAFCPLTLAIISALWIGKRSWAGGRARRKVSYVPCPWQFLIQWA